MIGLIAILLTSLIIALVSINMGVIGSFKNSDQSAEEKTNVANEINNLNTNLLIMKIQIQTISIFYIKEIEIRKQCGWILKKQSTCLIAAIVMIYGYLAF